MIRNLAKKTSTACKHVRPQKTLRFPTEIDFQQSTYTNNTTRRALIEMAHAAEIQKKTN